MAATPSASVVAAAPLHPTAVPDQMMYEVRQGDTLWGIADDKLGSGRRWPQIWKVNAQRHQADGQVFTDPDLIYPGWRLRIVFSVKPVKPVTPKQAEPPPTVSSRPTPPPPSPAVEDEAQIVVMIRLPSGSLVTLAYVAGISTAFAATRLLHRRRRDACEEAAPAVREARRSHTRAHLDRGEPVPGDRDLLRQRQQTLDVPGQIVIAVGADGSPVRLELSGLGLGIAGPGAEDVVRYLVNDLLQQSHNFRTDVLVCTALAERLHGTSATAVPGLTLAATSDAALRRFEEIVFTRQRILLDREADSLDELREQDPGEVLPAVVLVTDATNLEGLRSSAATGTAVIVLGSCPIGTTCQVDENHRVVEAEGMHAHLLRGAELCHLALVESAEHVRVLAQPEVTEPEDEEPWEGPIWNGPELIRLSVLGPPLVQVRGQAKPLDLSWLQLNTLAYLALHPEGASNAQLTAALWPDEVGKAIHNTLRHLREALVTATGHVNIDPKTAPFISASTTKRTAIYRLDLRLVSVDLHAYLTALDEAKAAHDHGARLGALDRAGTLCRGELLKGIDAEWIDEHRYPLTRSMADTLSRLAELCSHDDPEQAVDLLERVRRLEPGVEDTYLEIIRLQLRLGRGGDARRTVELLRRDLADLGTEPTRHTEQLIVRLLGEDHRRAS